MCNVCTTCMYKNCKLILTNYYYIVITNTLALQINKTRPNSHIQFLLFNVFIVSVVFDLQESDVVSVFNKVVKS